MKELANLSRTNQPKNDDIPTDREQVADREGRHLYWMCNFSMDPHVCRLVGLSVGLS